MLKLLTALVLVVYLPFAGAQYQEQGDSLFLDSISTNFPNIKNYPVSLAEELFIVLESFPELRDNSIGFTFASIETTLNARPTIGSLFFKTRKKRDYKIRINHTTADSMVTLDEVPFEARIGLLAHELCHFSDYEKMSFFGLIKLGWAMQSGVKRAHYEQQTDSQTIDRGFCKPLMAWSTFVLYESDASKKYKDFKRFTYLTPEEIELRCE